MSCLKATITTIQPNNGWQASHSSAGRVLRRPPLGDLTSITLALKKAVCPKHQAGTANTTLYVNLGTPIGSQPLRSDFLTSNNNGFIADLKVTKLGTLEISMSKIS